MKNIYLITIFIFLLSGCSITKPAITEYRLSLKDFSSKSYTNTCKDKSLKVSSAFSSNTLMTLEMNYMQDKHKIYSYSQSQWNNSPNQEISSQIFSALRDAKLFESVQNAKSRSRSDLILEINIQDFMQYFSDDLNSSYVRIVMCFTLIDAKTNKSIATKSFSIIKDVESLDAMGGVEALDAGLEEVINEGLEFLSGACR
ncbi:MAG: ABC-type transport auxiliary lipoprotein family protein [Sulfurimonas sp.]|uniref:ABC-type transport auxiliary lipoprotein family protein n=1 Tax=Sulfurimonas sp. TaxID=2022749 RepID=UPI0025D7827D|nr:ABC-type transport auxiliary lipoprotein family protein [Sulfurimonas sp.]MCK9492282.1 ABC-type transport auxiliary lipoprotein family protein [Sulfurimonas sp.]